MINDIKQLSQILQLSLAVPETGNLFANFPLQVPKSFVARMVQNDINDPLLLQILPQTCESQQTPGFVTDPLTEKEHSPLPGLIHKYVDRVLLLVSDICATNCRFCFRRHMREKISDWQKIFTYIKQHPFIGEVILSGGDPLMLATSELAEIINQLAKISHIKRLRIHSRVPIVMPEKVNIELPQTRLPIIMVVHCNHPNEIDDKVVQAINLLRRAGVIVFNQAVLLHGINDTAEILISLSEKLFSMGVLPYYLHILDKVEGTTHFYVNRSRAKQIHLEMQTKLPGYLVPKLVVEIQNKKIYV